MSSFNTFDTPDAINQPQTAPPQQGANYQPNQMPPMIRVSPIVPLIPSAQGDLPQLKGDARLVSFIDLVHNTFVLCFATNAAIKLDSFVKEVEKVIEYHKKLEANASDPSAYTKRPTYLVIRASGIDTRYIDILPYKVFLYMMVALIFLSGLGIWAALRLHQGTDLNRGKKESKNWAGAWPIINLILLVYFFIGMVLAYYYVQVSYAYGTLLTFMVALRVGSGLVVQRLMWQLRFIDFPVVMAPSNVNVVPVNVANSYGEPAGVTQI